MAKITIRHVMEQLIDPVGPLTETVDTLLFGNPDDEAAGIVTAFMPTQYVLERALELKANLVIAHEAPFYQHILTDSFKTQALAGDPVFIAKRDLIVNSGLALFRFHDYIHRYEPDGIMAGLIEALGWNGFVVKHDPLYSVLEVPAMTALEAARQIKARLGIGFVRLAGEANTPCKRIGLLAGYRGGGEHAIPLFEREGVDLVLYGEGPEWETPEYVRDAVRQGRARALIVLGHAESEEPGMKLLADRLKRLFPKIPVHFVAEKPVFRIV